MKALRLAFSRLQRLNGAPRLTSRLPNFVLADVYHHVDTAAGAAELAELTDAPLHSTPEDLVRRVLAWAETGRLDWEPAMPARGLVEGSSPVESVSLAELAGPLGRVAEHTIIIELVGEDEVPVPGVKYELAFPNGSTRTGSLDSEGRAEFTSLTEPGTCKVCFPTLDENAWEYVHATPV